MSLTRRIAHNTIIQFSSKIIGIVFGVLTVGLITRYLGQAGFGQYSIITAFLQFFAILVDFGLQLTVIKLMSDPLNNARQIFNNALSLRIITALVLFSLAPFVALVFPYDEIVKTGMFIMAINYLALSINQILIGLFQKELRMDKVAISEITGKIIMLAAVWLAVANNTGLLGIVLAIVASASIQVLFLFIMSLKFNKFEWSFDWTTWKLIISSSWPIAVSIGFSLIYFKADTIILSLVRTHAEVGIYSAPYRMLEILTSFPYLFLGLMLPILTEAWALADKERYRHFFQKTFDLLVIISVPMVAGTLPLAERIMTLIAGPQFAASAEVLRIIIFATAIIFVNTAFGYAIVILNKQRKMILAYVLTAVVALTLYIIFIPIYSYIAAAYITILAEALMLIFNVIVVSKVSGFTPRLKILGQALLSAAAMSGAILLLAGQSLALIMLSAVVVYFIVLYAVGGIKKETLIEILRIKS